MTYSATYRLPESERIRQGEILTNVPEIVHNEGSTELASVNRGFAAVITPDCDLERDWEKRSEGNRSHLSAISLLVGINGSDRTLIPKALWGKIRKMDHAASHAVEACPVEFDAQSAGLPALVFNFGHVFSLPTSYLYHCLGNGGILRRTQLLSPYRDHLIQRYCSYVGRVALEENHNLPKD